VSGTPGAMRKLYQLVGRFCRDEQGAFMALFGVMAIVVVAISGAAFDYVTLEQARNRAQVALDAAALSLQPSIYDESNTAIKQKAQDLLIQQIANDRITTVVEDISTDEDDGTLYLQARITVPTTFVGLIGVTQVQAAIVSQATRKKLFMEVAMVLDNSGSMASYSRMTNLKAAAKSATDILFDFEDTSANTFISVVPFNFWVNIGTGYKNATWMDQTSLPTIARDNFDNDDDESTAFTAPFNRWDLYNQLTNASWAGCVEARKYPYDVQDTTPTTSTPETMFIPEFAPDEPNGYSNSYLSDDPVSCQPTRGCKWTETYHACNSQGSNCDGWQTTSTYTATYPDSTVVNGSNACSCSGETILSTTNNKPAKSEGGGKYTWSQYKTCNDRYSVAGGLSERELQERICKYTGASVSWNKAGPNSGCVSTPLLPLNNNRATVKARIDMMQSEGYTNIHQGAIWGFHALSPTEPLTQGRGYDTATYKVMILMTDGENTYVKGWYNTLNGSDLYAPYGHLANGRIGTMSDSESDVEDKVDARLLETCANMKAAGIDIYTIGLTSPDAVKDMLKTCANGDDHAFFPTSSDELGSVFESIALKLADLRLSQ
jgi:Flp pilus assembly protein TadG